jgi:plasmid stabilization system protein ParE
LLRETAYYEKRQPGAGRRFRLAVQAAFNLILKFPSGGPQGTAGTRRTKVKGFPFTVVYREELAEIIIFAIAHDRKRPDYWRSPS